jgi:hypothetical protein
MRLGRCYIVRLNTNYVRGGELDLTELFATEDFIERVRDVADMVVTEMTAAHVWLQRDAPPPGPCTCIYRGRSNHCTTFSYTNPEVPEYSVHDIARIGSSKVKLQQLVDGGILAIEDVGENFPLTRIQRNQVQAAQTQRCVIDHVAVSGFLARLEYPITFLDYETYPCAIPRFEGYRPYDQIPFQFSLDTMEAPGGNIVHHEYLCTDADCPDRAFVDALDRALPASGSILVWSEQFEKGINDALALRVPEAEGLLASVNARVVDLMDVFAEQTYVHPEFRGRTSIKAVLPALVPQLTYAELAIQDGATACETWHRMVSGRVDEAAAERLAKHLLTYCALDTRAMFEIWQVLVKAAEAGAAAA